MGAGRGNGAHLDFSQGGLVKSVRSDSALMLLATAALPVANSSILAS